MKMIRKSGKEDKLSLERDERLALQKTIETCGLLAEARWADDSHARQALPLLVTIHDQYVQADSPVSGEPEGGAEPETKGKKRGK